MGSRQLVSHRSAWNTTAPFGPQQSRVPGFACLGSCAQERRVGVQDVPSIQSLGWISQTMSPPLDKSVCRRYRTTRRSTWLCPRQTERPGWTWLCPEGGVELGQTTQRRERRSRGPEVWRREQGVPWCRGALFSAEEDTHHLALGPVIMALFNTVSARFSQPSGCEPLGRIALWQATRGGNVNRDCLDRVPPNIELQDG